MGTTDDRRREAEGLALGGQAVADLDLRVRDRPDAGVGGGVPEPAVEVAADGLLPERLAPDAGGDDPDRRLSLAEAGDAERLREVRGRVLERVLNVRLGHLDLEANPAFGQLFDLRLHCEPLCQKCLGLRPGRDACIRAGR